MILPLPEETSVEILQRMLLRIDDVIDKTPGSYIYDALAPIAEELPLQREFTLWIIRQAFVITAEGEYLDYIAQDYGLSRGEDEDDESLRVRVLYWKRYLEHGGTVKDYERWAKLVEGVKWAKSLDKPRGIGTVDTIVGGDPDKLDELVNEVREMINLKKPLGVDSKVKKASVVSIAFRLWAEGIDPEVAKAAALSYLLTVDLGMTVKLSRLAMAVLIAGATDVIIIEPTMNIQLPDDCVLDPVIMIES
jgi:hypothetical protein